MNYGEKYVRSRFYRLLGDAGKLLAEAYAQADAENQADIGSLVLTAMRESLVEHQGFTVADLPPLPEGRSEQDHDCGHFEQAMANGEALAAARLRIKALEGRLSEIADVCASSASLSSSLGCAEDAKTWSGLAKHAAALLSSTQGETKEGFDGLPELPCGEQPGAGVGATAALAGDDALVDRIATAAMVCVTPHLKHLISFNNLWLAVRDALRATASPAPDAAALVE